MDLATKVGARFPSTFRLFYIVYIYMCVFENLGGSVMNSLSLSSLRERSFEFLGLGLFFLSYFSSLSVRFLCIVFLLLLLWSVFVAFARDIGDFVNPVVIILWFVVGA